MSEETRVLLPTYQLAMLSHILTAQDVLCHHIGSHPLSLESKRGVNSRVKGVFRNSNTKCNPLLLFFPGIVLGLCAAITAMPGFISPYIVGQLTLGNVSTS